MQQVVVREGRWLEGVDSARVWALVADPERLGEWSGLHFASYMGTEIPGVGHAFFAGPTRDPKQALRFEIVDWEAGRRYRCDLGGSRFGEADIEISVAEEIGEAGVATRVELTHRADVPRWLAPFYPTLAARRLRAALSGLEKAFT